jgi:hypothetical protein
MTVAFFYLLQRKELLFSFQNLKGEEKKKIEKRKLYKN